MDKHILVIKGEEYLKNAPTTHPLFLPNDPAANEIIVDLKNHPHAFVLACCMDRQMNAERAWAIPIRIMELIGDTSIDALASIKLNRYRRLFAKNKLHRFNDTMAEVFYNAVHHIVNEYDGDASKIWSDNPGSATVVCRFLELQGVGPKIATMATNILARDFHIPMSDYICIDVSVDVHIKRVMERMGLIFEGCSNDYVIYKARELSPLYPGIIDAPLWQIGREFCHPNNPSCNDCTVKNECLYFLETGIMNRD